MIFISLQLKWKSWICLNVIQPLHILHRFAINYICIGKLILQRTTKCLQKPQRKILNMWNLLQRGETKSIISKMVSIFKKYRGLRKIFQKIALILTFIRNSIKIPFENKISLRRIHRTYSIIDLIRCIFSNFHKNFTNQTLLLH